MKKNNYQLTMYACFIGYIVQAIVNNFLPLLFVTFQKTYSIPLTQITLLITLISEFSSLSNSFQQDSLTR